ncbi:aminodeoxychorismate synthase component I [Candidatus Omnitrophota bacterium]
MIDTDSTANKNSEDIIKETINIVRSIPKNAGSHFATVQFDPKLTPDISKENYIGSINRVLEYIRAGDIYQACLSQRFKAEWPFPSYDLYLKLNKINPSPFSSYLNFRDAAIISSSPELFLKVEDNVIETRPMKGTRPRGSNPDEDKALKEQLLTSTKDDAELSMIVDLERNDLGKVSVPGTVEVTEHRRIETYPTVFQAISIVKSRKEKDASIADVIKATFPGGSIAGCPKIRAMEIIDELEPTTRNVYTGAIGYISFHDTMELNMAIRTMLLKEKSVYFQVGGGIVADSDPETEYEETLHKARALVESLRA